MVIVGGRIRLFGEAGTCPSVENHLGTPTSSIRLLAKALTASHCQVSKIECSGDRHHNSEYLGCKSCYIRVLLTKLLSVTSYTDTSFELDWISVSVKFVSKYLVKGKTSSDSSFDGFERPSLPKAFEFHASSFCKAVLVWVNLKLLPVAGRWRKLVAVESLLVMFGSGYKAP